MTRICHAHCPDEGGLGLIVLAAIAVAAGLAVAWWVMANAIVLAIGAAGVVVATGALSRLPRGLRGARLAVAWWVMANAIVLAIGAAGVVVATGALYRLALAHTVLSLPVRRAVGPP